MTAAEVETAPPLRVLLVEDDPDATFLAEAFLESEAIASVSVTSMHEALSWMENPGEHFDAILLDLGLPDIDGLDGLRAASDLVDIPVIVLTGDGRPETRANAQRVGAFGFLVKGDVTPEGLGDLVRNAVTRSNHTFDDLGAQPYDGPDDAITESFDLLRRLTPLDRWAFVRLVSHTDLVLIRLGDGAVLRPGVRIEWSEMVEFPGEPQCTHGQLLLRGGGEDFAPETAVRLGLGRGHHRVGVLIGWCGEHHELDQVQLDLVTHTARQIATSQLLEEDRSRATRRAGIAGNAANIDPLTGLGNRRAYDALLRAEESRCARLGAAGTVFVIDLDGLKTINDRDGHAAGDRYLRAAAAAMIATTRAGDGVFRTGGDEFAMVAVGCDEAAAPVVRRRLRGLLEDHRVDASVGWESRPPAATLEEASSVADERMYAEKEARRAEHA